MLRASFDRKTGEMLSEEAIVESSSDVPVSSYFIDQENIFNSIMRHAARMGIIPKNEFEERIVAEK